MRRNFLLLAFGGLAFAQAPPASVLEYVGKPLRLPLTCGDEEIHRFGLTCPPEQPCPVYLELNAAESLGTRLFAFGNLHTDATTLYSVLLSSDDSGKTWREPAERIPSAGLDQIQFFDLENGWISGHVMDTSPRDPFFLLTTDGGKTWRRRPVYPEPKIGAIEQFAFDSRTSGLLWIDRTRGADTENRYELYETNTGGESWSVREVSEKPIPKKAKAAGSAAWRVRADAATRAYWLENHSGGKWLPVASFLVRAGECKEAEVSLPEPEPPSPPQPADPAKPKPPSR